jgi:hypothetical protein
MLKPFLSCLIEFCLPGVTRPLTLLCEGLLLLVGFAFLDRIEYRVGVEHLGI